jgi:hypothetical protein
MLVNIRHQETKVFPAKYFLKQSGNFLGNAGVSSDVDVEK